MNGKAAGEAGLTGIMGDPFEGKKVAFLSGCAIGLLVAKSFKNCIPEAVKCLALEEVDGHIIGHVIRRKKNAGQQ